MCIYRAEGGGVDGVTLTIFCGRSRGVQMRFFEGSMYESKKSRVIVINKKYEHAMESGNIDGQLISGSKVMNTLCVSISRFSTLPVRVYTYVT